MPRVRTIGPEELPPDAARTYAAFVAYGPFADQASVLAHVPPALDHLCRMLMELKARQGVPWRYIELCIVVASKLNGCDYCVASHGPVLTVEGVPADAVAGLPGTEHPALTDVDRLVVEFATQVTQSAGRMRDGIFARMREHFTEAQVVELVLRTSLAGFYNRFNDALQIDDGRAAALGQIDDGRAAAMVGEFQG